jgi:hypothetical protein
LLESHIKPLETRTNPARRAGSSGPIVHYLF